HAIFQMAHFKTARAAREFTWAAIDGSPVALGPPISRGSALEVLCRGDVAWIRGVSIDYAVPSRRWHAVFQNLADVENNRRWLDTLPVAEGVRVPLRKHVLSEMVVDGGPSGKDLAEAARKELEQRERVPLSVLSPSRVYRELRAAAKPASFSP